MQLSVTWGPAASVSPGKLQMCRNVGPIQISWIFIFNYFIFIEIHLIYNVVFISGNSKVIQLHTSIRPLFFRFFFHVGNYRA